MIEPTKADIGRWVIYRTEGQPPERGVIHSFNEVNVFVRYEGHEYGQATKREHLDWDDAKTPQAIGSAEIVEPAPLFLIWSEEHCMWWRPNGHGYTNSIRAAGRYGAEGAERIVKQANFAPHIFHEIAIPVPPGIPAPPPDEEY